MTDATFTEIIPTRREDADRERLRDAAGDLLAELQALVTAVTYADPPKRFNEVLCHEARVPVEFIVSARAVITKATGGRK